MTVRRRVRKILWPGAGIDVLGLR